jgi:phage tail-like protein
MPGIYQEDGLSQRLMSAYDEVLAPVFVTLDSIDAYFDPSLAPEDFVEWISSWVGFALDEKWSLERRRTVVAAAVELYRWRGTKKGLRLAVEALTGVTPDIVESGASKWALEPDSEAPGSPFPQVIVRLTVPDPQEIDMNRLDAVVADTKPAHIPHIIEVVPA